MSMPSYMCEVCLLLVKSQSVAKYITNSRTLTENVSSASGTLSYCRHSEKAIKVHKSCMKDHEHP
jgi:hypothetical protein